MGLKCRSCGEEKPSNAFSSKQKKKKGKRRCKECVHKDEPKKLKKSSSYLDQDDYMQEYVQSRSLNDEQMDLLKQLRERIIKEKLDVPEKELTDHVLARFLRARKYKLDAAYDQYKTYAEFRKEYDIENIHNDKEAQKVEKMIVGLHPGGRAGISRAGNPIYWYFPGEVHAKKLSSLLSGDQFEKFHVYDIENGLKECRALEKKNGAYGEEFLVCADCRSLGLGIRHYLPYFKLMANIDERVYPETIERTVIYNCPKIFPMIWKLVKPWLDPGTVAKTIILDTSGDDGQDFEALKQYIDPENIIDVYEGGKIKTPEHIKSKPLDEIEEAEEERKLQSYLVPARGTYKQEVIITKDDLNEEGKAIVEYYFTSEGRDIKFGVTFRDASMDENVLVKLAKCHSHKFAVWGEVVANSVGTLEFEWNNEYSYFTRKTINYSLTKMESAAMGGSNDDPDALARLQEEDDSDSDSESRFVAQ